MYSGSTKKMAITRQVGVSGLTEAPQFPTQASSAFWKVIDKKKGVQECRECDGRGVKVEVVRMGPLDWQTLRLQAFQALQALQALQAAFQAQRVLSWVAR